MVKNPLAVNECTGGALFSLLTATALIKHGIPVCLKEPRTPSLLPPLFTGLRAGESWRNFFDYLGLTRSDRVKFCRLVPSLQVAFPRKVIDVPPDEGQFVRHLKEAFGKSVSKEWAIFADPKLAKLSFGQALKIGAISRELFVLLSAILMTQGFYEPETLELAHCYRHLSLVIQGTGFYAGGMRALRNLLLFHFERLGGVLQQEGKHTQTNTDILETLLVSVKRDALPRNMGYAIVSVRDLELPLRDDNLLFIYRSPLSQSEKEQPKEELALGCLSRRERGVKGMAQLFSSHFRHLKSAIEGISPHTGIVLPSTPLPLIPDAVQRLVESYRRKRAVLPKWPHFHAGLRERKSL